MIGILAYGSLIADPGWEIKDSTEGVVQPVETPFPVEYARRSKTRGGAPTLVPVPSGKGLPVQAAVIVLKKTVTLPHAYNILYRREIHRPGDSKKVYREPPAETSDRLQIKQLNGFAGTEVVLYTHLKANFEQILDESYDDHEKSELLSIAARESLTEESFYSGQDGILYLDAASHFGVQTRLTAIYTHAVLALAGYADDLATARAVLAKSKGIITE